MLKRLETDLHVGVSRDPMPTVEVDMDSIPAEHDGYANLVTEALAAFAAKSPSVRATIYVYQGPSANFHENTWSAFFGVSGNMKLLKVLLSAFKAAKISNVRFSDYIDPSTATKDFHVEDGFVWRPWEPGTWFSESHRDDSETLEEDPGDDPGEWLDPVSEFRPSSASNPTRFRVARADASVETIRKKIETVFGLPEGSVALRGPDKKALRGDATIATLRKRWE